MDSENEQHQQQLQEQFQDVQEEQEPPSTSATPLGFREKSFPPEVPLATTPLPDLIQVQQATGHKIYIFFIFHLFFSSVFSSLHFV